MSRRCFGRHPLADVLEYLSLVNDDNLIRMQLPCQHRCSSIRRRRRQRSYMIMTFMILGSS